MAHRTRVSERSIGAFILKIYKQDTKHSFASQCLSAHKSAVGQAPNNRKAQQGSKPMAELALRKSEESRPTCFPEAEDVRLGLLANMVSFHLRRAQSASSHGFAQRLD